MKLPTVLQGSNIAQPIQRMYQLLASVINGQLGFGDVGNPGNINGVWLSTVTPSPSGTNFTLVHGLGRVPSGYLVGSKSASCDVYTGTLLATKTQITLAATVVGVTLKIFIF